MSSNSQKQSPKMCKSPKNVNFTTAKQDNNKIVMNEYENINTNCTVIGSNNLHLVKKPQLVTNMSPAYSNPSPSYPQSPYSSPASLKSPSPQLKPPTPQPSTFPVMQIIHNSQLLARPIQNQSQNIIKLKPHLNILPKPSASPQPQPKPSVSPQIVIPTSQQATATIMPTAQPLLLNQMPVITPGVQFILRPQTTKLPTQVQTATATPQGLILQPSGQQILQLQTPRSQQQMLRVVTNGMPLAPPTTTYVTHLNPQTGGGTTPQTATLPTPLKKKPKKRKQKLDLANIMKLSGIGDEDDIQFESDTSQSESEHNSVHSQPNTPQPQTTNAVQSSTVQQLQVQSDTTKKIGNIQISAVAQPTINPPLLQVLNQNFQSGQLIPTSTTQTATQATSIPFSPFITPNFTINNGLMVQRSGGFKLTLGEDGRLILQHDPTLNQDLQSQLLLQSIFGINGGLVLQPSIDQQVHSQTVQTIQQQSVQTIQQQTVQSQTIQTVQQQTVQPPTVQHSLQTIQQSIQPQIQAVQPQTVQQTVQQTIQHQTVQSQPMPTLQTHQPMQIVQPQPIQNLNQSIQSQTVHSIQQQVQPVQSIHSQIADQIHTQLQGHIQSLLQAPNLQTIQQTLHQNVQQLQSLTNIQNQQQHIQANFQNNHIHSQKPQCATIQPQSAIIQPQQSIQQAPQSLHQQTQSLQQAQQVLQQAQALQQSQSLQHTQSLQQSQALQQTQSLQPQPQTHSLQTQTQSLHTQTNTATVHNSQPILKVQPFQKSQPPVQTVHPQPAQQLVHHHPPQSTNTTTTDNHQHQQNTNPPPTSYVVNLTPEQLEQLKRNGQVTVNGQTIFMQRPTNKTNVTNNDTNEIKNVKLSPKIKPVKKIAKVQCAKNLDVQPTTKTLNNVEKTINEVVKEANKTIVSALQAPPKNNLPQNHVQVQKAVSQPAAIVQPSVQTTQSQQQPKVAIQQKVHVTPTIQQTQTNQIANVNSCDSNGTNQDVERLLGHLLEDQPATNLNTSTTQPQQRTVHTIQLTPQKQQHLKSIQLQIQTLSARLTPGDTEMQNALKLLFQEQQKILASGKLLPPDKVYYHNNQLTIVNPTPVTIPNVNVKAEPQTKPVEIVQQLNATSANHPRLTTTINQEIVNPPNAYVNSGQSTSGIALATPTTQQQIRQKLSLPQQHQQQQQQQQQVKYLPNFTKAQLIEQQMNTDQNGAIKPDINTPFRDKADACKRLIRYHCFDQPVLSQKDLSKADEIFELTARHFIDKFSRMVDKYRYLLLKESMRQVQTSELMMLDRMFLAEEQQSLIKLRQEMEEAANQDSEKLSQTSQADGAKVVSPQQTNAKNQQQERHGNLQNIQSTQLHGNQVQMAQGCNQGNNQQIQSSRHSLQSGNNMENQVQSQLQNTQQRMDHTSEEYDEWACIQRELGCLTSEDSTKPPILSSASKRSATSDSRLESLKKFRVDKHSKKTNDVNNINVSVVHGRNSPQQQNYVQLNSTSTTQNRTQLHHHNQTNTQYIHSSQMSQQITQNSTHHNVHFSHSTTQHIVQHFTTHTVHHNVHNSNNNNNNNNNNNSSNSSSSSSSSSSNSSNTSGQSVYNTGVHNNYHGDATDEDATQNNSIDEQVQSAIDSILNLQQNTSIDIDDAVSSILS